MLGRSRTWAVALLAAVFLAGGAAGWALARRRRAPTRAAAGPMPSRPTSAGASISTPAQQESVRAVFVRHHEEMQAIWGAVRPRLDSLRAVVRTEVNAHLTPDQQARYARLLADLEHQHDEHARRDSTSPKPGQH